MEAVAIILAWPSLAVSEPHSAVSAEAGRKTATADAGSGRGRISASAARSDLHLRFDQHVSGAPTCFAC